MRRAVVAAAMGLLAGAVFAGGEKVVWDRPEDAIVKSRETGKPILYYFLQTQQVIENGRVSGGGSC